MPPRKSLRRQDMASSSNPPPQHSDSADFDAPPRPQLQIRPPWPKQERRAIPMQRQWAHDPRQETESTECLNRPVSETWDEYDTLFYNAWLGMDIRPSRFVDLQTLNKMGIRHEVLDILQRIGLGSLPTREYDLYPDLVRQFLATCRVIYENERARVAQEGVLTFMCKGVRYRISIPDLCGLYGFNREPSRATLSQEFHDVQTFWSFIGTGVYETKDRKQTEVRHPAIRYVLRVLANSILCKSEPSKMRKTELVLLSHGLDYLFPDGFWEFAAPSDDLNMGAAFANHLCSLKSKAFAMKKFETVGSFLTPIFQYFGVITIRDSINDIHLTMDEDYLKNATWMKPGLNWVYTDAQNNDWTVKLPLPAYTTILDMHSLAFQPPATLLRPIPRPRRLRAGASSTAPPTAAEDDMVDDLAGGPPPSWVFPEPPEGYRDDGPAFREYMVSTMRQMWRLMAAAVTCSRPPAQTRRRRRSPTPEDAESSSD